MKNELIRNIVKLSLALLVIMLVSTLLVVGFNSLVGLSTDVNDDDVATIISGVAFFIALVLKYVYDRK